MNYSSYQRLSENWNSSSLSQWIGSNGSISNYEIWTDENDYLILGFVLSMGTLIDFGCHLYSYPQKFTMF